MDNQIKDLCDRANVNEIKKIHPIKLPIKHMIIYLETKIVDYEDNLSMDFSTEMQYSKMKVMQCIRYLKKVQ